jgi:hypothetical protein
MQSSGQLGDPGLEERFKMHRPVLQFDGEPVLAGAAGTARGAGAPAGKRSSGHVRHDNFRKQLRNVRRS